MGPAVDREVVPEDLHLTAVDREQTGEHAQQRRLPGAVRPAQQHRLTARDVEVDPGEGGEAAEEADDGAQTDEGNHSPTGLRDPADRGRSQRPSVRMHPRREPTGRPGAHGAE